MHDDSSRLLLQMKMLDQGIVPYTRDSRHRDVPEGLNSLTPKARRKAKRKFRKLWRKAVRILDAERDAHGLSKIHSEMCGFNNPAPTIRQKQARRYAVLWLLKKEIEEGG